MQLSKTFRNQANKYPLLSLVLNVITSIFGQHHLQNAWENSMP